MVAHGLSTGALFLLVGVVYERRHTRLISEYGGLWKQVPHYAVLFLIVMLGSVGLHCLAHPPCPVTIVPPEREIGRAHV